MLWKILEEDKTIQQNDLDARKNAFKKLQEDYENLPPKIKQGRPIPKEPDFSRLPYAKKGDTVVVHYIGYLEEGFKEFDNSYTSKLGPLDFTVGVSQV
jgi:FKBP-type peptidyl-prolyl cis-trans isomerase